MFYSVFALFSFSLFCFLWVLEVVTSVATSHYPFYFVFVPRVASNREEVWFGEVAVLKQILCCHQKKLILSARTSNWSEFFCAHAPGYYLTFICFAIFYMSYKSASKKIHLYSMFCFDRFLPIFAFASSSLSFIDLSGGRSLK